MCKLCTESEGQMGDGLVSVRDCIVNQTKVGALHTRLDEVIIELKAIRESQDRAAEVERRTREAQITELRNGLQDQLRQMDSAHWEAIGSLRKALHGGNGYEGLDTKTSRIETIVKGIVAFGGVIFVTYLPILVNFVLKVVGD